MKAEEDRVAVRRAEESSVRFDVPGESGVDEEILEFVEIFADLFAPGQLVGRHLSQIGGQADDDLFLLADHVGHHLIVHLVFQVVEHGAVDGHPHAQEDQDAHLGEHEGEEASHAHVAASASTPRCGPAFVAQQRPCVETELVDVGHRLDGTRHLDRAVRVGGPRARRRESQRLEALGRNFARHGQFADRSP